MNLEQQLERATDHGPAHPSIEQRLTHGRRAARRRTTIRAGGALASLALAGVAVAQLQAPDRDAPQTFDPAAIPTAPAQPVKEASSSAGWAEDEWARIDDRGEVTVRAGVEVVDRLDDPVPDATSVALEVRRGDTRRFVLLVLDDTGTSTAVDEEPWGRALSQFATEVYDADRNLPVALHDRGAGPGANLPLVGYDRGELYTVAGAEIVRVVPDPHVPGWCGVLDTAAVELEYEGRTYFAVLGDGNCEAAFAPKGGLSQTLEETIAEFRSVV